MILNCRAILSEVYHWLPGGACPQPLCMYQEKSMPLPRVSRNGENIEVAIPESRIALMTGNSHIEWTDAIWNPGCGLLQDQSRLQALLRGADVDATGMRRAKVSLARAAARLAFE